ncbi:hypothetical protein E4U31_001506 [Claviceps sp. LM219 group G6]|nr:hypothetical protein E4U15_006615 [Claviceps sp. LM218 group G6]KAG6105220.1 hypothetical protein E4U31_001506 [Claviceps sp. LM219 group G6]
MMATEPSGDNLAALSVSSQVLPLDPAGDRNRYDVPTKNGLTATKSNASMDRTSTSNEGQMITTEAGLSGGSDNEASRTERLRQMEANKEHGRSASTTKKPATFKAVSVNKTFLASKAVPGGLALKPIEKLVPGSNTPPPGSSALPSSRPRLIAKIGGGARESAPRYSSLGNGGQPVSAPDPSAVWNKNRPPEPKKFTDEELKKYGIHMASRLNEEDAQGQNKWADIDEDDEDWAPDAITWGDGTKTTLPHLDEPQGPTQGTISLSTPAKYQPKPKSPSSVSAAKATAPKPGGFASGRGLVLKPASQEKPSLVAKPSVPATSVKSPWATLPPVDRASPGLMDSAAVVQAQPKEGMQLKSLHHQPKEITADDFTRSSWREGSSHTSRELYNSQSGRYEPAPHRRGSFKSDPQTKQPALLQRPQPTDQVLETCGTEPTFQLDQDGLVTRCRGSSLVSTGSSSLYQRSSTIIDSTVAPNERPPCLQNSGENPAASGNVSSPTQPFLKDHLRHPSIDNTSIGATSASVQSRGHTVSDKTSSSVAGSKDEIVNEVEYQKKLMRERIELARKRRQAQEADEEAAKKERIQKKLEALGPPPEKRVDKKESSLMAETSKPTQIQQRERPLLNDSHHHAAERSPRGQKIVQPSIPNQPNSAQPTSQPQPPHQSIPAASTSFRRPSHGQDSRRNDPWGGPGPRPDRFPSWGSAAPPSTSRNVWGSPDNDRGLGNGTFNPDLGRVTNPSTASSPHAKGSLPIAPPRHGTGTFPHSQAQAGQDTATDPSSARYVAPGSELASKWVASVAENDQKLSTVGLSERASRENQLRERGLALEDSQPIIKDSWRPIRVPGDGTRHTIGSVDVKSHQTASWKSAPESLVQSVVVKEDSAIPAIPAKPGIIGCGASSQSRPSRFFPTRDYHQQTSMESKSSRSTSPSPPPPTMEDHPVYEGDILRPHVSLPKPQPVVKLPPILGPIERNSTRPLGPWSAQVAVKDDRRGDNLSSSHPDENIWQARFHKLLHGDKPSLPRDIGVDASSRGLEPTCAQTSAIVLLPMSTSIQADACFHSILTKPMAEDCFEEQEMGSLPQIRLPHKAPEAAWQPAAAQSRGLPKKFIVQASAREPFQFCLDSPAGSSSVNILFPGMKEIKKVLVSKSVNRGSRASHGPRIGTRPRGFGTASRGGKREKSNSQETEMALHRGGRAGFRNRNSDNWTRRQPQPSHQLSSK